jgi:hypothetical protein
MRDISAIVNEKSLSEIVDIAHYIWRDCKRPVRELVLFQALIEYLKRKGVEVPFSVDLSMNK